ncbi:MAG: PilZ domain-containing protein [Pseudomonadota bacterium]
MAENDNQRRYPRIDAAVTARLSGGRRSLALQTVNVSRNGVFVRTEQPLPERHLIKLCFQIPGGRTIDVVGMVARSSASGDGHPLGVGMGINFFAMSKDDRRDWDRFCLELERKPHYRASLERDEEQARETAQAGLLPSEPDAPAAPSTPGVSPASVLTSAPATGQGGLVNSAELAPGFSAPLEGLEELDDLDVEVEASEEVEVPLVPSVPSWGETDDDLDVTFISDDIEITVLVDEYETSVDDPGARISDEVSLDPNSPHTHTALGRVLLEQLEDPDSAVKALQRALECDPDYLEAHQLLRLAYALLGQSEKAMEHLRIARRLEHIVPDEAGRF